MNPEQPERDEDDRDDDVALVDPRLETIEAPRPGDVRGGDPDGDAHDEDERERAVGHRGNAD